ncbi:hypothetical protein BGZ73_001075 [Actinomortierella ambigua]|nr:hypothetical protein BGZ73_001075 [Actinomortierella ambigua]
MFPMAFRAQVVADKAALRKREVDPSCTSTITIKSEQQPAFVGKTFTAVLIKGGLNSQNLSEAGAEANLDIQFTQGLAPTHDIVISYGSEEQTVPREYAQRVCNGFAQLGARGVSVIVPSGDGGVGDGDRDPATQHCFTNDGRNITRFQPVFPATCPFVTSVGATAGINPEVAVSRFFSGGGFSWYFPQATYQAALVDAYLDKLPKGLYKGLYNAKGRAYPDVSAQGENYRIWLSGRPMKIGGTSASTPTFAAVISRLNERRFSQGKKPLGFLNPWLYGGGKGALNDILSGHNSGCGTEGFSAAPGWDPVTGLGTPDFVKMLAALPP